MNKNTRMNLDNLHSEDGDTRFKAMNAILKMTENRVDWANEVWEDLVKQLRHENNHQRAIAAQVLCNLAKSDTEDRMAKDFAALLAVTKDEGSSLQDTACNRFELAERSFKRLSSMAWGADSMRAPREKAMQLIGTETDDKYRKKYAGVWRIKRSASG
jgi:hypothetical protein